MATAVKAKPKQMKFRVKAGHHYHGELVWKEGMVLSSRFEMDKMFVNKFERVGDETPVDAGLKDFQYERPESREMPGKTETRKRMSVDPEAGFDDEEAATPAPAPDTKFNFLQGAADVTDLFPFVLEEAKGLKVLQNGNKFGVVHADNPRELLNANKPLKKGEVVAFVEAWLEQ